MGKANYVRILLIALVLFLLIEGLVADGKKGKRSGEGSREKGRLRRKHHYAEGDHIPVFVNKMGPYGNPSETYDYYSLPFCRDPSGRGRHRSFHEKLEGDELKHSMYELDFLVNITREPVCLNKTAYNNAQIHEFRNAVKKYYYFELLVDDIPVPGFIGTLNVLASPPQPYLFKHYIFNMEYNHDRVIRCTIIPDTPFYWTPTNVSFDDRMDLVTKDVFSSDLQIHWLSITNSFVLVVLLTGFIAIIIMRVLKNDYTRYSRAEEEDEQDYGWKLVHGDVFRFPPQKLLFCSFLGIGAQFLALVVCLLSLAAVGLFYPGTGNSLQTAAIFLYALTSGIGGYVSSSFYKQIGGTKWAWNIVATGTLFTFPFFTLWSILNIVAASYETTNELDFHVAFIIFCIWLFIGFPLTVIGGIIGRKLAGEFQAPVRTNGFAKEIPRIPWFRSAAVQYVMAGFLPFSAIYIELYYLFTSVWGHNYYTLYPILFLVFIILVIVTACITIALTYFQLSIEDHRWWWRSFISGGSTGFFIFMYSIFYYAYRSNMTGFFQTAFFFGYMGAICYFFFLMLGSVGFYASLVFIRHIYGSLHCE